MFLGAGTGKTSPIPPRAGYRLTLSTPSTLGVFRCRLFPFSFSFSLSVRRLSLLSLAWLGLELGGERLSAGGGGAFFPLAFLSLVLGTGLEEAGEGKVGVARRGQEETVRPEDGSR